MRAAGPASIFWLHDIAAGRHWLERWAAASCPTARSPDGRCTAATLPLIYRKLPGPCEVVYYAIAPPARRVAGGRAAARSELGGRPGSSNGNPGEPDGAVEGPSAASRRARAAERCPDGRAGWWVERSGPTRRYLEGLRAEAAALGIGWRVNFLGQRGDVARLLAAADTHCQPNTGPEPFGITFVEALYAGLPVVTTSIGGALEIVRRLMRYSRRTGQPGRPRRGVTPLDGRSRIAHAPGRGRPARATALCDPCTQIAALTRALSKLRPGPARDTRVKTVEEPSP